VESLGKQSLETNDAKDLEQLSIGRRTVGPNQNKHRKVRLIAETTTEAGNANTNLKHGENLEFIESRSNRQSLNHRRRARARRFEVALPASPDEYKKDSARRRIDRRSNDTVENSSHEAVMNIKRKKGASNKIIGEIGTKTETDASQVALRQRRTMRARRAGRKKQDHAIGEQSNLVGQSKKEEEDVQQVVKTDESMSIPRKSNRIHSRGRGRGRGHGHHARAAENVEGNGVVNTIGRRRVHRRKNGENDVDDAEKTDITSVSVGPRRNRERHKWRNRSNRNKNDNDNNHHQHQHLHHRHKKKSNVTVRKVDQETLDL
jgi:hypothetical protein